MITRREQSVVESDNIRFEMKEEKCGKKGENDNEKQRECLARSQSQGNETVGKKISTIKRKQCPYGRVEFQLE